MVNGLFDGDKLHSGVVCLSRDLGVLLRSV